MHELPRAGLRTPLHSGRWETKRFKYLFDRVKRPVLPETEVVTAFRDGVVTRRSNRREDGFTFADKEIGYQGIEVGDLAIHAMDGFAGAIGVSDSRGKVSPVLSVCVPKAGEPAEPRFWAYCLRNLAKTGFIESLAKGIRERSTDFRWKDAAELLVNFPDLDTQKAIADVLDKETARIDQLIEKKQRLVELLAERWSSTVDGLMFGPESEDWPSLRLRHLASAISKGTTPSTLGEELTESGVRFLKAENITPNGVSPSPEFFISEETDALLKRSRLLAADVLVVIAGATTGKSAVLTEVMLPANTNQAVSFVRLKDRSLAGWVQTALGSRQVQSEIRLTSVQSAQPNLAMEDLGRLRIPMPPSERRREIERHIQIERQNVERLGSSVRASIDRLKEYRSALITAAVTGQIDVTRWGQTGEGDKRLDQIQEEMAG